MGHDRRIVAYLTSPRRLTVACRSSAVVIMPFAEAAYPCDAMLVDETVLQYGEPMQITVEGRDLRLKRAATGRLWQR